MNTKDAFYFPHDSNAKDDPKIVLLVEQMGLEGYGAFWVLVEILRDQPEFKYPLALIPAIARRYNTTTEKLKAVVTKYGLFQVQDEEFFFSPSLNNRMLPLLEKKEQARLAAHIRWEKQRQLAETNKSNADAMRTHSDSNAHPMPKREEKSRVKKSRVNTGGYIATATEFYKQEIEKNEGKSLIDQYRMTADFILKQHVLPKIEQQMTYREFATCYNKAQNHNCKISDYLKKMENWKDGTKDVSKKNKSISQTLQNWMTNDAKRSGKIHQ